MKNTPLPAPSPAGSPSLRNTTPAGLASLLAIGLLASGAAMGQTLFYSNAGSGSNAAAGGVTSDGTLGSIGFDISYYNAVSGTQFADTGGASARPQQGAAVSAYNINFAASNLIAPPGTELSSVTLYLFASSINPDGTTQNYTLYDGLNATGGTSIVPISQSTSEGQFLALTLTGAQFLNGFSLSAVGLLPGTLLNISTENNVATPIQTPGISVTFAPVPEPSAALLGALGSFALLRRRRA